jgi:hypothetical protein
MKRLVALAILVALGSPCAASDPARAAAKFGRPEAGRTARSLPLNLPPQVLALLQPKLLDASLLQMAFFPEAAIPARKLEHYLTVRALVRKIEAIMAQMEATGPPPIIAPRAR